MNLKTIANLNMRSGPGTDFDIRETLPKGTIVQEITDWKLVAKANGDWGVVSAEYLEPIAETEPVPISSAPPIIQAMNFFIAQGWTPVQAAALVGNFVQESELKPTAVNPNSGATGIVQWLGSRLVDLRQRDDWETLEGQLEFAQWELENTEKAAGDALRACTELEEATLTVRKKYERCGEAEANDANRLKQARAALASVGVPPVVISPSTEVSGQDIVDKVMTQIGKTYEYAYEVNLNDPDPKSFDCSELIEWGCYQLGIKPKVPDGSANQKAFCIPIPLDQGIKTPGALLFHPGHVAVSQGNGKTVEAMGSKYGVLEGQVANRFDSAGLVPNVHYS